MTVTLDQLDLFADLDAAAEAVRQEAATRKADLAPSMFADPARGYHARSDAFRAWIAEFGNFDCYRRAHAWHEGDSWSGPNRPTATCRPALLQASLHCDHFDRERDCSCVGGHVWRAACLHCSWEGPTRTREFEAAADAHDHAWPGWRDLPPVAAPPDRSKVTPGVEKWLAALPAPYSREQLEAGGPIVTRRDSDAVSRCVPGYTPWFGWDMSHQSLAVPSC